MSDSLSELLRRLNFSAEVFFRSEYCGHWGVDTSGDRHIPFHLLVEGKAWLHEDPGPRGLQTGDLVLFPNDHPHLLSGSESAPNREDVNQPPKPPEAGPATRLICGFFKLDRQVATPLLDSLPDALIVHLGANAEKPVRDLAQLWIHEAANDELGNDLAVDRLAELVFVQMLRAETKAGRLQGLIAALSHPRIGPVLAAIHRDPGGDHQTRTMAARARLSESAFVTRFKAVVGQNPGRYVRHWRMHTAARLLTDTHSSISEIATRSGYESEVAFRKAFQAFFDEPPGRFRRSRTP